jgi:hypothetical protein
VEPRLRAGGMNGRQITGILTLLAPAVLLGVTVAYFGSNPLAVLVLIVVMIMGAMYLLTYPEVLTGRPSS